MTNDDLKRFYPVNDNQDKPESFVRYDKDGNIPGGGSGGSQIEKLDLVVGDPEVIYDTEDGITITSQGQITQDNTTYNVDVEQHIPVIAGEGIAIDASEDGKSIVIKKDKLYQHNILIDSVIVTTVINDDNTQFTRESLANYLYSKGFNSSSKVLMSSGAKVGIQQNIVYAQQASGIFSTNGSNIYYKYISHWFTKGTISDTSAVVNVQMISSNQALDSPTVSDYVISI